MNIIRERLSNKLITQSIWIKYYLLADDLCSAIDLRIIQTKIVWAIALLLTSKR